MIRLSSIFISMILGAVILTAQIPPVIRWQKTFGGSDREWIHSVIPSKLDNGYFLIIRTFSKDYDFDFMEEGQRICILKLDEKGDILWKRPLWLGGAVELAGRGIVTSDNKLLLSCLVKQENTLADFDSWIIMMNMEGEIEWQRVLGGSFDDSIGVVYETPDGNFIFVGHARSNDGTPAYNNGLSDGWIVKMNKEGRILSSRVYGGATSKSFGAIAPTEGGYLVHGSINYTLTGRYETIPGNKIDLMLTKIDENLDIVWQKVYGGSNEELWATIDRKENGNFIISSETFSTEVGIGNPLMGGGLWIYEVDEEGEIIWDLLTLEGLSRGDIIELKSQEEELLLLGNTSRKEEHKIMDGQYGERCLFS